MRILSPDDRQLIYRLNSTGYTLSEISELLGCTVGTVQDNLKRHTENPNWFPTISYLTSLGLDVTLDSTLNLVELRHPEGHTLLPFARRTVHNDDVHRYGRGLEVG
jgi:hypothetical protein